MSLDAVISEAGVHFTLTTTTASATSSLIPWTTLTQLVISRNPDLFGVLDEPLHAVFAHAIQELGFILPQHISADEG
ncbi:MAG: hypothetical protein IH860_08730 [Chloroflexi bacterium]|nr:hypothetical protein [Chloroflexota bacterium]